MNSEEQLRKNAFQFMLTMRYEAEVHSVKKKSIASAQGGYITSQLFPEN